MEERSSNKLIKFAIVVVALIALYGLMNLGKDPNIFTEKEHIVRVTKRIEKKYMTDETECMSFEVFPLYTQDDELKYFLVEFEPRGYTYVKINSSREYTYLGLSCSGKRKMYSLSTTGFESDGDKSYYALYSTADEKRYLLKAEKKGLIPAVKRGETYINLVSGTEVIFENGAVSDDQPTADIKFIPHVMFDL